MIVNVEIWNNHIRQVRDMTLTAERVENIVSQYPYNGEKRVKDPTVENSMLPPIALVFYSYLYELNTIPSPEVLIERYFSQEYFEEQTDNSIRVRYETKEFTVSKEGLISRIYRTYPSVLRDFHFYLQCVESGNFEAVKYSFTDDFHNGIDIKVKYNDKWHYIALMQNTKRSLFFRNKKKSRHLPNGQELINIELDQYKSKRCGDYNLYTDQHILLLLRIIKET